MLLNFRTNVFCYPILLDLRLIKWHNSLKHNPGDKDFVSRNYVQIIVSQYLLPLGSHIRYTNYRNEYFLLCQIIIWLPFPIRKELSITVYY